MSQTLTLCVIALLVGLHGLTDLHANDVNFSFTVLQHLLGRLKHFLILIEAQKRYIDINFQKKKDF